MHNYWTQLKALRTVQKVIHKWSWAEVESLKIRITNDAHNYNFLLYILVEYYSLQKHPYRFKA